MNHFKKSNQSQLIKNWQNFEIQGKVVVLYGGSTEREVSIESGLEVIASLKKRHSNKFEVIGFDLNEKNPIENLIQLKPNLVFIALHGGDGEDGTIQGLLQSLGIAYTGSSVLASSLSMDKVISKQIWKSHNLPTASYRLISDENILDFKNGNGTEIENLIKAMQFPFVIKPISSGSSLGVSLVKEKSQITQAYLLAKQHSKPHQMVMAEQYIKGYEITAGFLNDQCLDLILIKVENSFYDYDAKYVSNATQLICPAPIDKKFSKTLTQIATQAYQSLQMSGWGRIDLIIDENNNPFLLEANVIPGLTSHSLVPCAAKKAGYSFDDLVMMILKTGNTPR